ncbi:U6 snRNA-associated Sm-like protein LSm7 isoform 1-T1 [Cariama cristata]
MASVGGGGGGASKMADKEKKKKESILDLSKYIDKTIRVKFQGGREAGSATCRPLVCLKVSSMLRGRCSAEAFAKQTRSAFKISFKTPLGLDASEVLEASGVLKGFDPLLNLVLDGTIEYMRDPDDQYKLTEDTRQLGLVVCRGTSVVLICPQDGMEAIPNPFIQQQDG